MHRIIMLIILDLYEVKEEEFCLLWIKWYGRISYFVTFNSCFRRCSLFHNSTHLLFSKYKLFCVVYFFPNTISISFPKLPRLYFFLYLPWLYFFPYLPWLFFFPYLPYGSITFRTSHGSIYFHTCHGSISCLNILWVDISSDFLYFFHFIYLFIYLLLKLSDRMVTTQRIQTSNIVSLKLVHMHVKNYPGNEICIDNKTIKPI